MHYKKQGFPEENEFVLCTVSQVLHNSVFVDINEYGRQGMIHISEVSPGRIRNIRDYVKPGKVIVCKVLRVNEARGYIDLSLRRVNESQRRQKVNEIKQEQLAEKIVKYVAKQHEQDVKELYRKITSVVMKEYDGVYYFFEDVVNGDESLDKLGLDKAVTATLKDIVMQRIKPKVYELEAEATLSTYEKDGVAVIKEVLLGAEKASKGVKIYYKGGGKYGIKTSSTDIKEAKETMKRVGDYIVSNMEKHGDSSFQMINDKK